MHTLPEEQLLESDEDTAAVRHRCLSCTVAVVRRSAITLPLPASCFCVVLPIPGVGWVMFGQPSLPGEPTLIEFESSHSQGSSQRAQKKTTAKAPNHASQPNSLGLGRPRVSDALSVTINTLDFCLSKSALWSPSVHAAVRRPTDRPTSDAERRSQSVGQLGGPVGDYAQTPIHAMPGRAPALFRKPRRPVVRR